MLERWIAYNSESIIIWFIKRNGNPCHAGGANSLQEFQPETQSQRGYNHALTSYLYSRMMMDDSLGMCRLLHRLMYWLVVAAMAPLCNEIEAPGNASSSQLSRYLGHGRPLWHPFPTVLLPPATETVIGSFLMIWCAGKRGYRFMGDMHSTVSTLNHTYTQPLR